MTRLGRPPGRTKTKVSLSLDKDLVECLRQSGNMSEWVNEVLRAKLQNTLRRYHRKKQAQENPFNLEL